MNNVRKWKKLRGGHSLSSQGGSLADKSKTPETKSSQLAKEQIIPIHQILPRKYFNDNCRPKSSKRLKNREEEDIEISSEADSDSTTLNGEQRICSRNINKD